MSLRWQLILFLATLWVLLYGEAWFDWVVNYDSVHHSERTKKEPIKVKDPGNYLIVNRLSTTAFSLRASPGWTGKKQNC